jgi:hypothetical protein
MAKNFLWTTKTGKWPDIYIAKWTDPSSETTKTWLSPEDIKNSNPLECLAAGFLVEETKDHIKLVATVCANGYSGQMIAIPKKTLNEFKLLANVGKERKSQRQ